MAQEQAATAAPDLAGSFNFRVKIWKTGTSAPQSTGAGTSPQSRDVLGDGAFQECTGLEIEMDVQEHLEGGRNDGVVRLIGRGKYSSLVLKRGMLFPKDGRVNAELWSWMQDVLGGNQPVVRYDGLVEVLDKPDGRTVTSWSFKRALPQKIRGPELNAKTGDIAIEELHIAHEGLRMEI